MEKVKDYWLFILAYLTICAGIYHIAYWDTFGINGLAFLDVSDLVKSFIYPVVSLFGYGIYNFLIGYFSSGYSSILHSETLGKYKVKVIDILYIIILLSMLCFGIYLALDDNPAYYVLFAFTTGEFLMSFSKTERLFDSIPDINHKGIFIRALIYIPVFSYSTAKYYSVSIKSNYRFDYVFDGSGKKDTMKFLGKGGNYFIFTDTRNNKIFIISVNKIDTLILRKGGKHRNQ